MDLILAIKLRITGYRLLVGSSWSSSEKAPRSVRKQWRIDATYIKVEGRWCYLYRAINKSAHLVDVRLSDKRNQSDAEEFLSQCEETTGITLMQITSDKEAALYPAIAKVFPESNH